MYCNICGEYFNRGTSTLPNDYCDSCFNKGYVKWVEVKKTTKEIIDECNFMINLFEDDIRECEEKIIKSKDAIEWYKNRMNISSL